MNAIAQTIQAAQDSRSSAGAPVGLRVLRTAPAREGLGRWTSAGVRATGVR